MTLTSAGLRTMNLVNGADLGEEGREGRGRGREGRGRKELSMEGGKRVWRGGGMVYNKN